jgi:uncharacterized protein YutE (UPF0331/DUF86 family)
VVEDPALSAIERLESYVRDLREAQPRNFEAYERDKMLRRYMERMLHMAIDTAIQVGLGILTAEAMRQPENYHDIFIILGENGILPPPLVDSLTALVEFRNLLVYEHTGVDDAMVYGFAKKRLDDLSALARVARAYLLQSADRRPGHADGSNLVAGSP